MAFDISAHVLRYGLNQQSLLGEERPLVAIRHFFQIEHRLESLSIIAYKQPVTRAEIEYIRGVDSGAVLKTLLSLSMIRILGRKDAPGRPILYGTTREFLEYFGLRDIESLPTLEEVTELLEDGETERLSEGEMVEETSDGETERLSDEEKIQGSTNGSSDEAKFEESGDGKIEE